MLVDVKILQLVVQEGEQLEEDAYFNEEILWTQHNPICDKWWKEVTKHFRSWHTTHPQTHKGHINNQVMINAFN